ncbi:hypothetical protein R5R35_004121 [Gryllus longicercus]|uniref:WW domain binding protein VOPP1 n=1 Tax=Gryllus longicercus TaxID=2509291 RepID=A0AAN9VAX0_9ORTH
MTAPPSAAPGAASAHTRPFNVEATSKYCDGGQTCPLPKECCPQGCCALYPPSGARPPPPAPPAPPPVLALVFWNNWYLWLMLVLALASCAGGCGLYRRRRHAPGACCGAAGAHLGHPHAHAHAHPHPLPHARAGSGASERSGSPGSCCAPPHYSRCASLHLAPPPYTEVTAKPDLYPLVFGYVDGAAPGKGVPGAAGAATGAGSYLMVQYFRNYIVRPIGSLSGASTVDSLSSGFLCSAANEANSMVPPPYSCTGSLDEFGLSSVATGASGPVAQTPLPGSGSCAGAGTGGGGSQRFVSAAALSAATGSEASSLAGAGAASPPRATSPTLELRSLLGRISRAYLPLPPAPPPPPRRWLSRSAPATPCSALLPPLPSAGAGPGGAAAVADGCSPLLAGDADDDEEDEDDDDEGACRRLQRPV